MSIIKKFNEYEKDITLLKLYLKDPKQLTNQERVTFWRFEGEIKEQRNHWLSQAFEDESFLNRWLEGLGSLPLQDQELEIDEMMSIGLKRYLKQIPVGSNWRESSGVGDESMRKKMASQGYKIAVGMALKKMEYFLSWIQKVDTIAHQIKPWWNYDFQLIEAMAKVGLYLSEDKSLDLKIEGTSNQFEEDSEKTNEQVWDQWFELHGVRIRQWLKEFGGDRSMWGVWGWARAWKYEEESRDLFFLNQQVINKNQNHSGMKEIGKVLQPWMVEISRWARQNQGGWGLTSQEVREVYDQVESQFERLRGAVWSYKSGSKIKFELRSEFSEASNATDEWTRSMRRWSEETLQKGLLYAAWKGDVELWDFWWNKSLKRNHGLGNELEWLIDSGVASWQELAASIQSWVRLDCDWMIPQSQWGEKDLNFLRENLKIVQETALLGNAMHSSKSDPQLFGRRHVIFRESDRPNSPYRLWTFWDRILWSENEMEWHKIQNNSVHQARGIQDYEGQKIGSIGLWMKNRYPEQYKRAVKRLNERNYFDSNVSKDALRWGVSAQGPLLVEMRKENAWIWNEDKTKVCLDFYNDRYVTFNRYKLDQLLNEWKESSHNLSIKECFLCGDLNVVENYISQFREKIHLRGGVHENEALILSWFESLVMERLLKEKETPSIQQAKRL